MSADLQPFGTQAPYIACFVVFKKDGKIAMVLRKNTNWMNGFWGLPSGKVENRESFIEGAIREAKEEVGATLQPEHLRHLITAHRYSKKRDGSGEMHWVDVYFETEIWEGELYNAEPDMHADMQWFPIDSLPENTIPPHLATLQAAFKGETYFEWGFNDGNELED